MSDGQELEVRPEHGMTTGNQGVLDAPMEVGLAQKRFRQFQNFIQSQMKEGVHYGVIPGTKKKSLYKPGAEAMLNYHGLSTKLEKTEETQIDFEKGFFHYTYKATVSTRDGRMVAVAEGSCNSMEAKYRYNWVYDNQLPKGIEKADCEEKNGKYRIENNDPYTLVNTFQKMAQKRALVGAAVIACRASDIFSTDFDDDGTITPQANKTQPTQPKSSGGSKGGPTISDAQGKRFYAIWKKAGKTESQVKAKLQELFGTQSSKDITKDKYNELCAWAEDQSVEPEEETPFA